MAGQEFEENQFVNILRLSDAEAAQIFDGLKRNGGQGPKTNRRHEERLAYESTAGIVVKMHQRSGSSASHLVRVRNLSSGGVGFLHGSFVYTGTRCTIVLRKRNNKTVSIEGTVVRCEHVCKHIHEVGLQFEKPIQVSEFIASAVHLGARLEASQELPHLSGNVLYVEDSLSDQELLTFHLSNVGVKVKAVNDVLTAVELTEQMKFDAVITNVWLPTLSGMELAQFLRQNGYKQPIIALTSDGRAEVKAEAAKNGCTELLVKPYPFESLLALLEPHFRHATPGAEGVLMSELWSDERMRPLIRTFLMRLRNDAKEVERLISIDKTGAVLRKLSLDIKGTAGGYGYPKISQAAESIFELLLNEVTGEQLQEAGKRLVELSFAACAILDQPSESQKPAA